jgi:phage terminase small subunit
MRRKVNELKLTEKQKRFADYYIETGNATQSAIKAGYSKKTAKEIGSENLSKPNISDYIAERMEEKDKERIASQDEILETLTKVLRGEEAGTELVGVGKGAQTVEQLPPSIEAKIRAAELLGKRYALWTDKQSVDVTRAVTFVDDIGVEDET